MFSSILGVSSFVVYDKFEQEGHYFCFGLLFKCANFKRFISVTDHLLAFHAHAKERTTFPFLALSAIPLHNVNFLFNSS